MNTVVLIGHLTRDWEVKELPSGTVVAKSSIAINERRKNQDIAHFFELTAFGKTAELASKYTGKGSKIAVEGRLSQDRWQTQEGEKKSKVGVIASRIEFLDKKQESEASIEQPSEGDIPF